MQSRRFTESLAKILDYEGGKIDDPHDPGGRTNQGVTQRTYDLYRESTGQPKADVFDMTDRERNEIYFDQYWSKIHGDSLPPGVDLVVFDGAVHSGPAQSIKWLQRALGDSYKGRPDGLIGMLTLQALNDYADHDDLIEKIADHRMAFLRQLKGWNRYRGGWVRRVGDVTSTGQQRARGGKGPYVLWHDDDLTEARQRAMSETAKDRPGGALANMSSGIGGVLAVGSQTVEDAKYSLMPYAANSRIVSIILGTLTVAGVCLLVAGIYFHIRSRRQAIERDKALGLDVV